MDHGRPFSANSYFHKPLTRVALALLPSRRCKNSMCNQTQPDCLTVLLVGTRLPPETIGNGPKEWPGPTMYIHFSSNVLLQFTFIELCYTTYQCTGSTAINSIRTEP